MSKLLFILLLLLPLGIYGQCTTQSGYICISQEAANKYAALADSVKAKDQLVIDLKAQAATLLTQVSDLQLSVKDRDNLIAGLTRINGINDNIIVAKDKLQAVTEDMLKLYIDMYEKTKKQLTAGKTRMQKFLDALKVLYYGVAAGAIIAGL